ncbi:MAG: HigA family addiction module antitoxin [Parasutterella excrementihominis]
MHLIRAHFWNRVLEPLGISQAELAQAIGVSRRRINELIVGKRSISTDTAIRLSDTSIPIQNSGLSANALGHSSGA